MPCNLWSDIFSTNLDLFLCLNENFLDQTETVLKIMKENNFDLKHKKRAEYLEDYKAERMKKIYNYVFERK